MRSLYLNDRIIDIIDGTVADEVNAAGSATFTSPVRIEPMLAGDTIRLEDSKSTDPVVWVGRVLHCAEDRDGYYAITCEGAMAFLNDSVMEPYSLSGNASAMLAAALTAHNAQSDRTILPGVVTVDIGTDSKESIDTCSVMHYLSECVDRWGGYMHVRPSGGSLYLDWLAEGRLDAGAAVIGENISDYSDDEDGEGLVTTYMPLGALDDDGAQLDISSIADGTSGGYTKSGKWVWRNDLVAKHGHIRAVLDSEAETAADLLAYAKGELAKKGTARVTEVEIVPGPGVLPGRKMRAILPGGQAKAIVTRRTWVLDDESQDTATIGTAAATLSEATSSRDIQLPVHKRDGDEIVAGDLVVGGMVRTPYVVLPDPGGGGAYSEIWSNSYGAHFIVVRDSSGTPLYRYYFSQSENIAVQKYNTSTSTYDAAKYYVRGTSILFHNNFNTTSVDVPIGSIAANGGTKWITYSVAKTGYTPIAISGWYLDGASTLQIYCLRLSGTDASIALRNPNSSASSSSAVIHVQVLYAKTAT